jgi:mannose-6-phosphate isomerase-like protein (cupin superfamily)
MNSANDADDVNGGVTVVRSKAFTAAHAWDAIDVANLQGVSVRVHWTDKPYVWHVNDGQEVFAVLDGCVEMRFRNRGAERSVTLDAGDVFYAPPGTEHVAHPVGEARVLVVEMEGSI